MLIIYAKNLAIVDAAITIARNIEEGLVMANESI